MFISPNQCFYKLASYKASILLVLCFILLLFSNNPWAFSPYSNKELDELEKEFVQQINQSNSVVRNALANQYINHLATTLARHGDIATPVFFIVKSNEINAFAGPGGYIGVNTQLILASGNESELAAVMAHEMAHVRQHHLYRMIEHEKQMHIPMLASMLASIALGVINPALGSGALMGSLTGFAQDNINFVRSSEKEADSIGIDMLIKSGLDPRGMAGFFKKMQQSMRYYYTDNVPAILRTHPMDDDRIAEAESRSLHIVKQHYNEHPDYALFKELIRNTITQDYKKLDEYYQRECMQHNSKIACQYGSALTWLSLNNYQRARACLQPLLLQRKDNLFFEIAMAHAESGSQDYIAAIKRLAQLQANYPDNYAVVIEYAQVLMSANHIELAASVLLKGWRQFKNNLTICQQLAQAQAESNHKDYAYFTLGLCHAMQGENHDALRKFKYAKTLAGKNHLFQAQIDAKIDEIKGLMVK